MKQLNVKLTISAFIMIVTSVVIGPASAYAATSPTFGAAGSYSVLGHTTVTNTGATTMPGDLGISIGGAPTGFPPGTVGPPGTIRNAGDSLAAQNDDTAVFLALSAAPNATCDVDYGAVTRELAGSTLAPGIYCANAFQLSGSLDLDAEGDVNAVWIFRSELSTLNTSAGVDASVQFTGEVTGSPCNVWWKVASSATIGAGTSFLGNIMALTSISMGTGATLDGRALAQTGAVTLDTNTFTAPACLTTPTYIGGGVTPGLPNTGHQPATDSNILVMVGVAALTLLSLAFVVRKKRSI